MSKIKVGDVKAYHGPGEYTKIGVLFREDGGASIYSIKLDALPLPSKPWSGWCNIFPPGQNDKTAKSPVAREVDDLDDDIPF